MRKIDPGPAKEEECFWASFWNDSLLLLIGVLVERMGTSRGGILLFALLQLITIIGYGEVRGSRERRGLVS